MSRRQRRNDKKATSWRAQAGQGQRVPEWQCVACGVRSFLSEKKDESRDEYIIERGQPAMNLRRNELSWKFWLRFSMQDASLLVEESDERTEGLDRSKAAAKRWRQSKVIRSAKAKCAFEDLRWRHSVTRRSRH